MKNLLLAAAIGALSTPALAGSLVYDQYSFTGIGSITITSPNDITGGAGPITLYEKGKVVVADAWCLDVDAFLAGSGTVGTLPFTIANAEASPGVPSALSATQLGEIGWLVNIGDHTSDATLQGAVQVAIWSAEYSNFAYNSLGATFASDVSADLATALSDYSAHGNAPGMFTLLVPGVGATSQTLVFGSGVPEPSTWAMLLGGFGLLGLVGWKKRGARLAV